MTCVWYYGVGGGRSQRNRYFYRYEWNVLLTLILFILHIFRDPHDFFREFFTIREGTRKQNIGQLEGSTTEKTEMLTGLEGYIHGRNKKKKEDEYIKRHTKVNNCNKVSIKITDVTLYHMT